MVRVRGIEGGKQGGPPWDTPSGGGGGRGGRSLLKALLFLPT